MTITPEAKQKRNQILIIIVASLGYFVDIYDLTLFGNVKASSLAELKLDPSLEVFLFNCQMGGMLTGGILWGILGDKKGRLKVLFGSILLYSIANIANAYVWDLNSYAVARFIAGVGLAGELGAGITLISETMHKDKRGYGTMIIVTFGALGAVVGSLVADSFHWKTAYWVGGLMGLALLFMRIGAFESGMYKNMENSKTKRGSFFMLFNNWERIKKYILCILMGLPVWYVVGVLIYLAVSNFNTGVFKIDGKITTQKAIMFCYIGLSVGDLLSGILSQVFKSRIKVVAAYLMFTVFVVGLYLFTMDGKSPAYFYFICTLLGIGTGYWALFVTIAAEQFGTNIRSTVTNTVPNFVRGSLIPISKTFVYLVAPLGMLTSGIVVGSICLGLAFLSTIFLKESFGKDLNYMEE
jgi:MFS transporter, putative metabolite:H+ symporter